MPAPVTNLILFFCCASLFTSCAIAKDELADRVTIEPATAVSTQTRQPTPTTTITPHPTGTYTATPTTTATPAPTVMPSPTVISPHETLIFVSEGALVQWHPQTSEVETLTNNVSNPIYGGDIAVFVRKTIPDEAYALVAFHIPTHSEREITVLPHKPIEISLSPDGHWVIYALGQIKEIPTLIVHEIQVNDQGIAAAPSTRTWNPQNAWSWPYNKLIWATNNLISWSDKNGIWLADLQAAETEPFVAVEPSTNTYEMAPLNPAEADKGSFTTSTTYLPQKWSPDGRFLLVVEYFFEDGVFRIIDRESGQSAELPESYYGVFTDDAVWLDDNQLLHLSTTGKANIWQVDPVADPSLHLIQSIPLQIISATSGYFFLTLSADNHVRFLANQNQSNTFNLFEIDLATNQLAQSSLNPNLGYDQPVVTWNQAGDQALLTFTVYEEDWVHHIFVDDLDGDVPLEISKIVGKNACCFYWYTEE